MRPQLPTADEVLGNQAGNQFLNHSFRRPSRADVGQVKGLNNRVRRQYTDPRDIRRASDQFADLFKGASERIDVIDPPTTNGARY